MSGRATRSPWRRVAVAAGLALGVLVVLAAGFVIVTVGRLETGRREVARLVAATPVSRLPPIGAVDSVTILPLVDARSDDPALQTEAGVSYLVTAGGRRILFDLASNARGEHPSPLLHNAARLGVDLGTLDMIVVSHAHMDHVGGLDEQRARRFGVSQGAVALPPVPAYVPEAIAPSAWNPAPVPVLVEQPRRLAEGIASTGPMPRQLYLLGRVDEQALAIRVQGKGIVLVIGCGHPTVERLIERAQALFGEPLYAIVGGLHFPLHGGRVMIGPVDVQRIVGSDRPPWAGLDDADLARAIDAIRRAAPRVVAVSPHDSSDWALDEFRRVFGPAYVELVVGREIRL